MTSDSDSSHDAPPESSRSNDGGSSAHEPGRKRRKVARSRAGCLTCRKRRKLCDMGKPACAACERLRMECIWPEYKSFENGGGRSPESNRFTTPVDSSPSVTVASALSAAHGPLPPVAVEKSVADTLIEMFTSQDQDVPPIQTGFTFPPPSQSPTQRTVTGPDNTSLSFMEDNLLTFDDATLQMWAADCLPSLTANLTGNPFDSLCDVLLSASASAPGPWTHPHTQPTSMPTPVTPVTSPLSTIQPSHSSAILSHYQNHLSSLVSVSGQSAPNAYESFTTLAIATMVTPAGQGLHLSILAWAGRHMVNQGQPKFEAVSERLGAQASATVMSRLGQLDLHLGAAGDDGELVTLTAGLLMLLQFKICRGDVWGYDMYIDQLSRLAPIIFDPNKPQMDPSGTTFQFFENLVYHDTISSSLFTRGPIMDADTLRKCAEPAVDVLQTLTGVSLQTFCIMHQVAALMRQSRTHRDGIWNQDELIRFVDQAEKLKISLEDETTRLTNLIKVKPQFESHRYFHEAFRLSCLLQLRVFVLGNPPSALDIRALVGHLIGLLEAMCHKGLPGFCSAHWILFTAAICAAAGKSTVASSEKDDRTRSGVLYDKTIRDFGFLNVSRSRQIVEQIWSRNEGGQVVVHWLDVLSEYDWEIIFA